MKSLFVSIAILSMACITDAKTFNVNSVSAVNAALVQARNGDVVQFTPGTYKMQLTTAAHGVTFQGAPDLQSRLVYHGGEGQGEQAVAIKHDDITIRGLWIDGEGKGGYQHGLMRFYTSRRFKILNNRIIRSKGSLISVGGSVPGSVISDGQIIGNEISTSGTEGLQWGEAIYVGSNNSPIGAVKNIEIAGNYVMNFSDNGVDIKASAQNISVHHNVIGPQVLRTATGNHGTIVSQGTGHSVYQNIMKDLIGGSSIFNLTSSSSMKVYDNAIIDVRQPTEFLVRSRGGGSSTPTRVERNAFCQTSTKAIKDASSGLIVRNNAGIDKPAVDCEPLAKVIMAEVKKYQVGTVVTPPPLSQNRHPSRNRRRTSPPLKSHASPGQTRL